MFPQGIDSAGSFADEGIARAIARHDQRRLAGIPTVSVLPAEPPLANMIWRTWIRRHRPAVELTASSPRALTHALLDALGNSTNLPILALHYLQRSAGVDAGESRSASQSRTPHDLDILAQAAVDAGAPSDPTRAALEICGSTWTNSPSSTLANRIEAALAGSVGSPWLRVLAAVNPLLSPELSPAILLSPPVASDAHSWLCEAASHIAQLAQAVPQWTLAVAVSPEAFDRYCREAQPSRAKSLLQSGVISLRANDTVLQKNSGIARVAIADSMEMLQRLKSVVPSPPLVASYKVAEALRPRQDEAARSAAERFLFELLEAHPASKGRFVLNGNPGFDFGPRAAEVDLLAIGLRLAVEVDGYYHFTEPASFRRDRRKDWELQRRKFMVVRVLADDVVTRMDEVLDFILAAVEHCGRNPTGEEVQL
jgi:hypothetical protein